MSMYPETIPASIAPASPSRAAASSTSSPSSLVYKQRAGYYAVHYASAEVDPVGAEFVMAADGGGAIAVFKGDVKRGDMKKGDMKKGDVEPTPADPVTPVYATSNGLAAVPTGQVFVRFAAGVDARDRAAQLQAAGYTTVKVLDFAPQGAWVQAGSIAASLNQLQSLESLENIEIIEPQMLMERSLR